MSMFISSRDQPNESLLLGTVETHLLTNLVQWPTLDVAIFSLLFQAYKKATLIMTLVLRSTRLAGTCFPAQTVVFFNSILQPSMLLSLCIIGMFCHSVTRFSATTTTAVIALLSNRWMESVLYCFMPFVITICEVWSVKYIVCVKPDFGVDPTQWHQLRQPAC